MFKNLSTQAGMATWDLRWEFIKENKKIKKKQENSLSTKKVIKKKRKHALKQESVKEKLSFFLTFFFSFINSNL